jgi:peptide chain release factor 2
MNKIDNNMAMLNELKNTNDLELQGLLEAELNTDSEELSALEIKLLLSDKYDKLDALIEIHAGAGGTEAMDWASMLARMYKRYAERHNFKLEPIDEQFGEEAGYKSVSFILHGMYAYGYLKGEKGVHRLIRISPFDANKRRHTSFASVEVTPLFLSDDIDIDIKDEDLKVDIYRSSGHGGQGVNTTDSAVRITHLPTKIVVTCQNERSQIQNRAKALEVLKSKLYQLEVQKRNDAVNQVKGEQKDINFGSQIRSYIMCPYTMVKDHRTNEEVTNVDDVLDGNIDSFINAYLKGGKK